jgi:hypothetical protein
MKLKTVSPHALIFHASAQRDLSNNMQKNSDNA